MVAVMLQWKTKSMCLQVVFNTLIYDDEKNQIRDDIERKEWR